MTPEQDLLAVDKALHELWLMRDWDDILRFLSADSQAALDRAVERQLKRHFGGEPGDAHHPVPPVVEDGQMRAAGERSEG